MKEIQGKKGLRTMELKEKIALLAELFEVEEDMIKPECLLDEFTWDSMTQLGLIAMFRSEFNKRLEPNQIRNFSKIEDILKAMDA